MNILTETLSTNQPFSLDTRQPNLSQPLRHTPINTGQVKVGTHTLTLDLPFLTNQTSNSITIQNMTSNLEQLPNNFPTLRTTNTRIIECQNKMTHLHATI